MNRYCVQKRLLVILFTLLFPLISFAKTAITIDTEVDIALQQFYKEVPGSREFLQKAKGALIFPKVYKAGIGIGGEYGEGALRIHGKTVAYYSTAAASVGLQLGVQQKSIIIAFMTDDALAKFRKSQGWRAGVDGSIAIAKWGAGEDINSITFKKPIIGFIFGNKGLMYNLTIEGAKFTRIHPK